MELKKYNANHTQVLKINQIVRTISETHKFDKDKLIAINTSDVENGVMGNGTLTFVDELKGQFKILLSAKTQKGINIPPEAL